MSKRIDFLVVLSFFRKKLPIVVRLSSVGIIYFRGNLISYKPIDLKIGLNVRYGVRHDYLKLLLQVVNLCNLHFFANTFVCTVLTDLQT